MISAVLDTNVLASGAISAFSPPGQILNAWRAGKFELILSQPIIEELKRALHKVYFQKYLTSQVIAAFIDLLQNEATITQIIAKVSGVATHPEDDLTLAAALSVRADYLVTGDRRLIQKVGDSYQKVNLVTPNEFLQILRQS